MTTTIENLRAELEELEKRVRAISATQTSLSQLIEMRKYFESMHNYLVLLNNCYTNHQIECNQYSTQIESIQEQLETINQKIENSDSTEIQEINEKIETLTLNLNFALSELDTIKGGSENTIANLTLDVETNKINISSILEEIEEINTKLSNINALLSDHQTQINNLSSTQNTISTTTSNLNSRLTAAEQELSAITGGVDLTELSEKVSKLDQSYGESYSFRDYNYGFSPTNKTLFTREYYFSVDIEKCVKELYELCYESTATGTMTIELIKNHVSVKTIDIDLSKYPNNYKFHYKFIPATYSQATRLKITSTTEFTFNSFNMEIFGTGITQYRYDNDVKVACFNNEIYITRYVDNTIKYGKFTADDEIDLENLPNTANFYDDKCSGYTFCQFMPTSYPSGTLQSPAETLIYEGIDGNYRTKVITQSSDCEVYERAVTSNGSGNLVSGCYNGIRSFIILNDKPCCFNVNSSNSINYFTIPTNSNWKYVVGANANFYGVGYDHIIVSKSFCIALNKDGYFYNFPNMTVYSSKKIAKGNFATAYLQSDNSINCYITNNKTTYLYNLINSTSSLIKTFIDCDCIYETYNKRIIKHTVSTNTWSVETLS